MKILTAEKTKRIEEKSVSMGLSWLRLMENAGAACANAVRKNFELQDKNICIVCGKGGNGGDGLVMARRFFTDNLQVSVILTDGIPTHLSALENYRRAKEIGVPIFDYSNETVRCLDLIRYSDIIIDAVFGFGFYGTASGIAAMVIGYINKTDARKVAIDIPSGAECDSGEVNGECIRADMTVTFTTLKPCHVTFPAAEYCGRTVCVSIGMPDEAVESEQSELCVIERQDVEQVFAPRRRNTHKGSYGKPLLVCGSYGMAGAAIMAGKAALRCGAGVVTLALPKSIYPIVAPVLPEAVFHPMESVQAGELSDALCAATSLLIGPGLGRGDEQRKLCNELINQAKCPVIIDADGINALSGRIDIIENAKCDIVLTPHPGEMADLLGITVAEVEHDRVGIAATLADRTGAVVVLKGAYTVVALPNSRVYINTTGSAGMATGGSGDVLSGMIAAFLGRGFSAEIAAKAGVYLHGAAGELATGELSETAMLPTDLIERLPLLFK